MSRQIPVANDTRWNSHHRLHCHIIKFVEEINSALSHEGKSRLCLSTADRSIIADVNEVMQFFAEATDIIQCEEKATFHRVIPVIDSLENALHSINWDAACINALCERLLNSLDKRFSYLLESRLHIAATALDPSVKLSFADNASSTQPGKKFIFDSSLVKRKLKELLPSDVTNCRTQQLPQNTTKKPRLLDYIIVVCHWIQFLLGQVVHMQNCSLTLINQGFKLTQSCFGESAIKLICHNWHFSYFRFQAAQHL